MSTLGSVIFQKPTDWAKGLSEEIVLVTRIGHRMVRFDGKEMNYRDLILSLRRRGFPLAEIGRDWDREKHATFIATLDAEIAKGKA